MHVKKKKPLQVLLASLLVIVLYFAVFPYPTGRELVVKPMWAMDLSAAVPSVPPDFPTANEERINSAAPFELGEVFGYVSTAGDLLFKGRSLFRVVFSGTGFINYSRLGTTWIFQDVTGRREFSFSGSGYPIISRDGERLFTVKTDSMGIQEVDGSGDVLWSRDFPCLITSLSLQPDYLLAGTLDGALQLVDRRNAVLDTYVPGGSRIPVIVGCSVSRDGSRIASVSGIDPQILTVLSRQGSSYQVDSRIALSSDFRREIRMSFSPDGGYLVFEGAGSVEVYDTGSRALSTIAMTGGLSAFSYLPSFGAVAFLSGGDSRRELVITKPFRFPRSHEYMNGRNAFLGEIGHGLLLGMGNVLMRIDLQEL